MSALRPCLLARLLSDRRGTSVIETAVIIPVMAMLVAGITDVAMGFSARLKIQQAASRTVALATAAGMNSSSFASAFLQAEAATAAGVPSGQVTVDQWLECAGVRQASFDGTCFSGDQVARFVSITITGSYHNQFPVMQSLTGSSVALRGYAMVRMQ